MTKNRQSFGHYKVRLNYLHMSVGIGVAVIMLLIYFPLYGILKGSTPILIAVFNFLFIFLIFPLEGSLLRKVFLLFSGNFVGLAWYLIQSSFVAASAPYLEVGVFKVVYVIFCPIIDLVWIVSVWSLSLSVLATSQRRKDGS
ncbi:MAG: hypothetical protein ACUVRA_01410 [Candidatus Bathyarchaeaceae archaeon]